MHDGHAVILGPPIRLLDVGIDVDGPLYDFPGAVREFLLRTEGPGRWMPEPTRWRFGPDWGFTDDEFSGVLHAGVDAGVVFRTGAPAVGAAEALHRLANDGHRLHLLTDRATLGTPGVAEATTRAWLADHAIPYTTLTLTADKTSVWTDVMVEDRPDTCGALEAAGTVDYLLRTRWNRENNRPRLVRDMAEFAHAVRAHAADPAYGSRRSAAAAPFADRNTQHRNRHNDKVDLVWRGT